MGTRLAGERERTEGQVSAPGRRVHTHTCTHAYMRTHTYTGSLLDLCTLPLSPIFAPHPSTLLTARLLRPCPRRPAAHSSLSRQGGPSPNRALSQFSGPAHCRHNGLQAFMSSSAPLPAFALHRPSAVFAPVTLASLPLLCAPAFAHAVPSTWNTFLSHPPGRLPCVTQLSCHFLRTSRVPIGPLSQGLWPPTLCPHGVAFPSPLSYAFQG